LEAICDVFSEVSCLALGVKIKASLFHFLKIELRIPEDLT
jgi:hypothetical protein